MKYIVIYSDESPKDSGRAAKVKVLSSFEYAVTQRILDGWTPLGGVSVAHTGSWPVYAQAMVKTD